MAKKKRAAPKKVVYDDIPDNFIDLKIAAAMCPRINGRPQTQHRVYSWANRGCRGRKLQVQLVGGIVTTTVDWLAEFLAPDFAPAAITKDEDRVAWMKEQLLRRELTSAT